MGNRKLEVGSWKLGAEGREPSGERFQVETICPIRRICLIGPIAFVFFLRIQGDGLKPILRCRHMASPRERAAVN